MKNRITLLAYEIEYSCSPGGVDEWELYSLSENLLYSSENYLDLMRYAMEKFPEYEITLVIKSLASWHKEQEEEERLNAHLKEILYS